MSMILKYGTTFMIDPEETYSLKDNIFGIVDIFDFLPVDYYKYEGKIWSLPYKFRKHGVMLFSGKIKGVDVPYDVSPKDVFVGTKLSGMNMEVKKVKQGDCIIVCSLFGMVVNREDIDRYFVSTSFFQTPLQLS